ncbi:MAG: UDP-glucose dehydrogenase family protein [Candidatus Helarchaeota archaeon]
MKVQDIHHISVVGLGYVGLVTSLCLVKKGYLVTGIDINSNTVTSLKNGKIPFYEPELDALLKQSLTNNHFYVTSDYNEAIPNANLVFLTVGTPSNKDGTINLTYIKQATQDIGSNLNDSYRIIVVKSTVVPGTTDQIIIPLLEQKSGLTIGTNFGVCVNPEFLKEGSAVADFLSPSHTIIGQYDAPSGKLLSDFFRPFGGELFLTTLRTAEMIKYANNAFLATKISFINEIANICRSIGNINIKDVAQGIGLDSRINPKFLRAGCGFGGSCFPKDLEALIGLAQSLQYSPLLLEATLLVNARQADLMIKMALEAVGSLENKKIALLGLAFKPNTSDIREAPSLRIINRLLAFMNVQISAYDPMAIETTKKAIGSQIEYASSIKDCLTDADICFIVTEWDEFKQLPPTFFTKYMKHPIIIDGRNIYDYHHYSKDVTLYQIGFKSKSKDQ